MNNKFLSADIFLENSTASSPQTPSGPARSPLNVCRTYGGVRRKIILAEVRRIRAEPGRVRVFPPGLVRNRGRRSSAEPIAFYFAKFSSTQSLGQKKTIESLSTHLLNPDTLNRWMLLTHVRHYCQTMKST